jgi:biotin operon repressor
MTDAERVLRLLTNASVKQADLAFVLGISTRKVQECLQALRLEGVPVFSSEDGVRLAQTADEARACSEALRRRLVSQYRTYKALRNTARRMKVIEDSVARATLWDFLSAEAS